MQKKRKLNSALNAFKKALSIDPENMDAKANLKYLQYLLRRKYYQIRRTGKKQK